MKSWSQEPEADDRSSQPEEGLLDVRESVKSSAKPTKGMQPRDGPLDEPAIVTQAATVLGVAFGQHRSDSHPAQETPNRFRVKTAGRERGCAPRRADRCWWRTCRRRHRACGLPPAG